jgi:hypothetical protein
MVGNTKGYGMFGLNLYNHVFLVAGDPHNIPMATGDPFKTLFVARIVSVTVEVNNFCV